MFWSFEHQSAYLLSFAYKFSNPHLQILQVPPSNQFLKLLNYVGTIITIFCINQLSHIFEKMSEFYNLKQERFILDPGFRMLVYVWVSLKHEHHS